MGKGEEKDRKRLLEILNSHPTEQEIINEAIEIIRKYDGIQYAGKVGNEIVENAWKELDKVLPESEAKKTLKSLADYCLQREI